MIGRTMGVAVARSMMTAAMTSTTMVTAMIQTMITDIAVSTMSESTTVAAGTTTGNITVKLEATAATRDAAGGRESKAIVR